MTQLIEAYRFFRENAGNIVGESAVCAMRLARAERAAQERGWTFDWQWDDEPYELGDGESDTPTEVLGCVLRDESGRVLGSLWGIGDPSPAYVRVVQAELASEACAVERHACSSWLRTVDYSVMSVGCLPAAT